MEITEILKLVRRNERLETLFEVLDKMVNAEEAVTTNYISKADIRVCMDTARGRYDDF